MKKLASIIGNIVSDVEAAQKVAQPNDLSLSNESPNISSDISLPLQKVAQLLKESQTGDISYDDLHNFIKGIGNV